MSARREKTDLDAEWRYHFLCVPQINGNLRGHMYDEAAGGSNNLPREGLYVASHWRVPLNPIWGSTQGKLSGETVIYFRTAVHEFGHALGLDHAGRGVTFMRTTEAIAGAGTSGRPFPDNIEWSFAPEDEHRLQHWSDMMVRPGGAQVLWSDTAPLEQIRSDKHRLEVTPVLAGGAAGCAGPCRVAPGQHRRSERFRARGPQPVVTLRARPGHRCPRDGTRLCRHCDRRGGKVAQTMAPGAVIEGSLTLLQGTQGTLFPTPGDYRVLVEASWTLEKLDRFAVGATRVTVTPAVDAAHADVARKLLATPETLLVLAFGGDHLKDGIAAIHAALGNPVLRPHFAFIEAKRVGQPFGRRKADPGAAAALIDATTAMITAELRKARRMVAGDPEIERMMTEKHRAANVGESAVRLDRCRQDAPAILPAAIASTTPAPLRPNITPGPCGSKQRPGD